MTKTLTTRPEPRKSLHYVRNDDIDLPMLATTLMENKRLIVLGTAAFFLIGVAYLTLATPKYEANAVVQVERRPPALPGTNSADGQTGVLPEASASTEIQLVTSRRVLEEAMAHLDLDIQVEPHRLPVIGNLVARSFARIQPDGLAPAWFGYGWGGERIDVSRLEVPDALLGIPLQLRVEGRDRYTLSGPDGDVLVEGGVGQSASGEGVHVRVDAVHANAGTRFTVTRADPTVIMAALKRDISAAEQGRESGIISLTYADADPQRAKQVLDEVTQAYIRQNVTRNSAEAAKRLQFVSEQLPNVREELSKAQEALNAFQKRTRTLDVQVQNRALLDQTVTLGASIQQLRIQMVEAAGRYTREHPAYRTLQRQIGQFEAERSELESRIQTLPDIQQGLFRLNRDVEVTNQTYASLLDQAQQLNIARASAVGSARIVDPAAVERNSPAWPKPLPVLAGSIGLGSMLMIALVLLRQTFRRGVEDPVDIELLGMPVFASVPFSKRGQEFSLATGRLRRDGRPTLLALRAPSDLAMEALRTLRTSLHFARQKTNNNLMMIVAPSPGVGKTFVCANLAVTMAQAGQRVVLVDADMRRGTVHLAVGTRSAGGLSELLAGKISLDEAVRKVPGAENLSFISRGAIPPNPSELLMDENFARVLKLLERAYDVVIIDTPPVLAVTDAALIGHHIGTSLMVVRWGHNQQREIAMAKQRLEQNGVEVTGAIFNGVQNRGAGRYAYSHYAYLPANDVAR
ncbi:polysaccharide biosynthesis tyrosine autokinase [Luteimonas sp. R10]|uniref:polysaccharide biosynthesis tyrosine autokinase n=1 Tax=Luteimonas sp. R10 TaxID=3108176 RepID=UPI003086E2C7|nr:polysaccharide biosynthesis tyrosine autokinase [Luteimonas sp. R10]